MRLPAHRTRTASRHYRHGFTLLEMTIALMLVALMAALAVRITPARDCIAETRAQQLVIGDALRSYVRANNRYPMPAPRGVSLTSPQYGVAVGSVTAAIDALGSNPNRVLIGALPFATLGLNVSYGSDCWGNKFTYLVTETLTSNSSTGYMNSSNTGKITVNTGNLSSNSILTDSAAYAVISHGASALGASNRNSTSKNYCTSATGTRVDRENCDLNNTLIFSTAFSDGKGAAHFFDDLVIYGIKEGYTGCAASTATWHTNCSASVAALTHNQTVVVGNTGANYAGSTSITCLNGSYSFRNSTCRPLTDGSCAAGSATWSTNCSGPVPVLNLGDSFTVESTAANYSGTVTVTCTEGTLTQYSPTCTARCASRALKGYSSNRQRNGWTNPVSIDVCTEGAVQSGQAFTLIADFNGSSWVMPDKMRLSLSFTRGTSTSATNYSINNNGTYDTLVNYSYDGNCTAQIQARYNGGATDYNWSQVAFVEIDSCPADGGWSGWSDYVCDAACGGSGQWVRYRTCTNPPPRNGGAACSGSTTQTGSACTGDNPTWCADDTYRACTSSFTGNTLITMADGSLKRIDQLQKGDAVRGQSRVNHVVATHAYQTPDALYGFNEGTPFVTGGHPFMTTQGWKAADPTRTASEKHAIATQALREGDTLLRDDGSHWPLTHIATLTPTEKPTVYNPSMDGDHTYYANHLLVHNKPASCTSIGCVDQCGGARSNGASWCDRDGRNYSCSNGYSQATGGSCSFGSSGCP